MGKKKSEEGRKIHEKTCWVEVFLSLSVVSLQILKSSYIFFNSEKKASPNVRNCDYLAVCSVWRWRELAEFILSIFFLPLWIISFFFCTQSQCFLAKSALMMLSWIKYERELHLLQVLLFHIFFIIFPLFHLSCFSAFLIIIFLLSRPISTLKSSLPFARSRPSTESEPRTHFPTLSPHPHSISCKSDDNNDEDSTRAFCSFSVYFFMNF